MVLKKLDLQWSSGIFCLLSIPFLVNAKAVEAVGFFFTVHH